MDGGGDIFSRPKDFLIGKPRIHFCRSFSAGGVLEHHSHAIDDMLFKFLADHNGGRNQATGAPCQCLADGRVNLPKRACGQGIAVLIRCTAAHGITGIYVLGNGFLHKTNRGVDINIACDHLSLIHHTTHTPKMVDVRVRIHNGDHRTFTQLFVGKLQCRLRGFQCQQHIKQNPAAFTFDECHIGQIVTTNLIDKIRHHFIQTIVHVECGLTLKRWVNAVEVSAIQQEVVTPDIPDHIAGSAQNLPVIRRGNKPAL